MILNIKKDKNITIKKNGITIKKKSIYSNFINNYI